MSLKEFNLLLCLYCFCNLVPQQQQQDQSPVDRLWEAGKNWLLHLQADLIQRSRGKANGTEGSLLSALAGQALNSQVREF